MPWVAVTGQTIEFPYALHAKVARAARPARDDVLALVDAAKKIHDVTVQLDARVREVEGENLRLKHENEFMLRLINQKLNES